MINWLLARLKEPSTATALAGLLAATGLTAFDEGTVRDIMVGVAAVLAVLGVGLREKGG